MTCRKPLGLFLPCLLALLAPGLDAAEYAVHNPEPICGFGDIRFDSSFPGGRISECRQTGKNRFSLGVAPENQPVNPSPWYAFRVWSERRRTVSVHLHYAMHEHRYPPKISADGESWRLLSDAAIEPLWDGKAVRLELQVRPNAPLYVSAQEIIDNRRYGSWSETLAALPHVEKSGIGESLGGRPISALISAQASAQGGHEWVLIVGRQHPPEVTGAMALLRFVEIALGDSALAKRFRERFNLLMVPNMNPDGVAEGHWRHNFGGVDLNRDWGAFTQPETGTVAAQLARLFEGEEHKLVLGLDFHSTHRSVLYTQEDGETPHLPMFAAQWLEQIRAQVPGFEFERAPSKNAGRPVFKHYISETYGIPAITYEMGDQTDREAIRQVAEAAAEAMMRILLDS